MARTIMKSYQKHVEEQCIRNPCLSNLCRFLSDPHSKQKDCRIASLDFFAGAISPTQRIIGRLHSELLDGCDMGPDDKVGCSVDSDFEDIRSKKSHLLGRILIVEDLTKEVVEVLGSCLDIDPLFFATHIHAPWKELESQTPDLATLPSRMRLTNYTNIHYHRTIVFEKVLPPGRKLLRDANVDRKIMVLPMTNSKRIGLAQHSVSILRITRDTHWIGI
jgi:hypothetical protein